MDPPAIQHAACMDKSIQTVGMKRRRIIYKTNEKMQRSDMRNFLGDTLGKF